MNDNSKKEEKKKAFKIMVKEPATLNVCVETTVMPQKDLATIINQLFKTAFADYEGCNLKPTAFVNGVTITPLIYFRILKDSEYKDENKNFAFVPDTIENSNNNGFNLNRYKKISNPFSIGAEKYISITEEGKSAISEFINTGRNSKSINWNEHWKIINQDGNTFVCVTGIDIIALIKLIYGSYDTQKGAIDYTVQPTLPSAGAMQTPNVPANYGIQISRAFRNTTEEAANALNVILSGNNIPMVRA